jgi:hypothetical protein
MPESLESSFSRIPLATRMTGDRHGLDIWTASDGLARRRDDGAIPGGNGALRADVQSCLRDARIGEIRARIKAGTFLTPQRKDGTVERLLKILG